MPQQVDDIVSLIGESKLSGASRKAASCAGASDYARCLMHLEPMICTFDSPGSSLAWYVLQARIIAE